jgi:hypothetical protein
VSDDTERIYELSDELSRDARAFEEAAAAPLPESASDESGAVTVALVDGTPTVEITDAWRDRYEPDGLAAGVLATFQALVTARTAEWATHAERALGEERPNVPIPSLGETTAGKLRASLEADPDGAAAALATLENILAVLDDFTSHLDESFDEAQRRSRAGHRSEPESHHLTVDVTEAGDLVGLTFSEEWLRRAAGAQISRELNDAIVQARSDAASGGAGPLDGTPLAKYQRFADDPDAFVRLIRGEE